MRVRFYRRTGPDQAGSPLPDGLELRAWRPASGKSPPASPFRTQDFAWLVMDRLGVFASRSFEELTIWSGERLLHRLIVTPRWLRFPFMARDDLQIGGVWTSPVARRTGLAAAAIAEAHRRHAAPGQVFWYVTDEGNEGSAALAMACGYRLAGSGRRTRPLGVSAIGQFRLESPLA